MTKLDHTAIRTFHYEEAQTFFKDVFNMHMWREIGEKPDANAGSKKGSSYAKQQKYLFLLKTATTIFPLL